MIKQLKSTSKTNKLNYLFEIQSTTEVYTDEEYTELVERINSGEWKTVEAVAHHIYSHTEEALNIYKNK